MISIAAMMGLISRGMSSPGYIRHGWTIHEWDISGSCISPQTREMIARPLGVSRHRSYGPGPRGALAYSMILHTKCRKCSACRELKRREWTARAVAEVRQAHRSWWGTLTFAPDTLLRLRSQAQIRLASGGTVYEALSLKEQFDELMREVNEELTLYLKRVRAESGATLRYLAVAETHQSGEPHLHLLMHEDTDVPVRKRTLEDQWAKSTKRYRMVDRDGKRVRVAYYVRALGFTKWRLTDETQKAVYLCKYISKSPLARVRASVRYGSDKHARQGLAARMAGDEKEAEGTREKNAPENTRGSDNDKIVDIFGLTYRSRGAGEYGWHLSAKHRTEGAGPDFQGPEPKPRCRGTSADAPFHGQPPERKPVPEHDDKYDASEAFDSLVRALDYNGIAADAGW